MSGGSCLLFSKAALAVALAGTFALASALSADDDTETLIEIKAVPGLRYDISRFRVAPGAKVRLTLKNEDDMAHNLIVTAPGARMAVVTGALAMPITPTQTFIPKSDKVLFAIPMLTPGKSETLAFIAPAAEGIYPYVCTYPGHGFIMFGAMYVTKKELPPLANDPNIPPNARTEAGSTKGTGAALHAYTPTPPYLYRLFMRDCGPAAIAVALPGGQNYCWDAGACRLRYAWKGAFLDPLPHWKARGDAFAEVKGRIYYRAGDAFPLRLGGADKLPVVKFRGYRLVDRYPEFRYELDGVEVRELIKPQHHGGLMTTFAIDGAKTPVFYVTGKDAGAAFTSSEGEFKNDVLELLPEKAKHFTIAWTEIPGKEPIAYWSMNDVLPDKFGLLVPGVKGRAIQLKAQTSRKPTDVTSRPSFDFGVKTDALEKGATFALWVQLVDLTAKNQFILGAGSGQDRFVLGCNLGGPSDAVDGSGFGVVIVNGGKIARLESNQAPDKNWHHVAATISPQDIALFIDGKPCGSASGAKLPASGAPIRAGTLEGMDLFSGMLDEARIYDRVLDEKEIRALYENDRPETPVQIVQ